MGDEGDMPVSVPELEAVYFDYDRSTVREDQKGTLRGNSQQINSHNEWATVVIEGHCDERGSEEYNLALGERRATSVKSYLDEPRHRRGAHRHGELRREQAGGAGPRRVGLEVEPPRRVQGHQALARSGRTAAAAQQTETAGGACPRPPFAFVVPSRRPRLPKRGAPMPVHGGKLAARALKEAGVEVVFTLSGGHIMPLYDGCIDEGIRIVDVRHEQAAVHAADAWARCRPGSIGVAAITAGPGVTDGVTGIANAWRANSPILVFGGQGPFANLRRGSLQEMDHIGVVRPITKYADAIYQTHRIPEYVELAIRHAVSGIPGPAYLEIPMDVFMGQAEWEEAPMPDDPHRAAAPLARPRRGAPRDRAPRRARSARC